MKQTFPKLMYLWSFRLLVPFLVFANAVNMSYNQKILILITKKIKSISISNLCKSSYHPKGW